jgi:hypothetical protein
VARPYSFLARLSLILSADSRASISMLSPEPTLSRQPLPSCSMIAFPMRFVLALVLDAVLSVAIEGQTAYLIRASYHGPETVFQEATVVMAGSNVNASFQYGPEAAVTYTSVVSHDGGKTWIALNSNLHTWFRLDRSPFTVHSRLFSVIGDRNAPRVRELKCSVTDGSPGGAGSDVRPALIGRLSYETDENVTGHRLRTAYAVIVQVWSDPDRPGNTWLAQVPFVTEIPAVDAEVARNMSVFDHFPRQIAVTITRRFAGGPAVTETTALTVEPLASPPPFPAEMFVVPADYREQPPVIMAPGR